jgi:hypothetical protein
VFLCFCDLLLCCFVLQVYLPGTTFINGIPINRPLSIDLPIGNDRGQSMSDAFVVVAPKSKPKSAQQGWKKQVLFGAFFVCCCFLFFLIIYFLLSPFIKVSLYEGPIFVGGWCVFFCSLGECLGGELNPNFTYPSVCSFLLSLPIHLISSFDRMFMRVSTVRVANNTGVTETGPFFVVEGQGTNHDDNAYATT